MTVKYSVAKRIKTKFKFIQCFEEFFWGTGSCRQNGVGAFIKWSIIPHAILHYSILYCSVLHYTVSIILFLYTCSVLRCTILHCSVLHYTILHFTLLHHTSFILSRIACLIWTNSDHMIPVSSSFFVIRFWCLISRDINNNNFCAWFMLICCLNWWYIGVLC